MIPDDPDAAIPGDFSVIQWSTNYAFLCRWMEWWDRQKRRLSVNMSSICDSLSTIISDNQKCVELSGCDKWTFPKIPNLAYKVCSAFSLQTNRYSRENGNHQRLRIQTTRLVLSLFVYTLHFQGKWSPKLIANLNYFEPVLVSDLTTVTAIGIELWTMSDKILFDNFCSPTMNRLRRILQKKHSPSNQHKRRRRTLLRRRILKVM